jgi:hypothetical protein
MSNANGPAPGDRFGRIKAANAGSSAPERRLVSAMIAEYSEICFSTCR